MKVTKDIRKEIKFALKRGDSLEQIKKNMMEQGNSGHKKLVKV